MHRPESLVDEAELIERIRMGDATAEREFYDRYVDRVYRLIHRMSRRDDLAQEWTQDTFVRAFERIEQFRGDSALSTWLHSIAVSITLNGLRGQVRREYPRYWWDWVCGGDETGTLLDTK